MQQIQDLSDVNQWNYVPSEKNPADLASRGVNPGDSEKLQFWLEGPKFLHETCDYNRMFEEPDVFEADLELRSTCATDVCMDVNTLISRYSNIQRLQKAVVWLKRFAKYLRGEDVVSEISVCELEGASTLLIKYVQHQPF